MANIFPDPKDVISAPNQEVYTTTKKTRPEGGIVNYGLARLVDLEDALDQAAMLKQYGQDLAATNEQRSVLARMAAEANAANEARKQNLDFGAAARDSIALEPILNEAGVPMDPEIQRQLDTAKPQSVLAKIAKDRADANQSNASAAKSNQERTTKIKTKYDPTNGVTYELTGAPGEADLSQLPPNVAEAMRTGKGGISTLGNRDNGAGGTSFGAQGATAAAPVKAVMPSGRKAAVSNVQPLNDGTFVGEINQKGVITKVRIDADGNFLGRQ